ncbi:MAG: hypothetical protein M1831_004510 [Alyxoria varia]|nr:MAG: hypothetical protein M1831_004510 [Alyxoria varia]
MANTNDDVGRASSEDSDTAEASSVTLVDQPELQETPQHNENLLPLEERKRIIITETPKPVFDALFKWINRHCAHIDESVPEDDEGCMLHLSPPDTGSNTIQTNLYWDHPQGRQSVMINFGVAVIVIARYLGREEGVLTQEQLDGFINNGWHLSHLCGNWTCLNIDHYTIEPGSVNISRNGCFSQKAPCQHKPRCMREHKRPVNELRPRIDHPYLNQFMVSVEDQGREEDGYDADHEEKD